VFDRLKLDSKRLVAFDPRLMRPAEVDILIGDYSKAKPAQPGTADKVQGTG
jgi:GDP-D-mannose dehydratase